MANFFCSDINPTFLVLSPNVPQLIYYSHGIAFTFAIFMAFFVLFRKRNFVSRLLFFTLISFAAWVFLDSVFWASNRGDVIMFVWDAILLIEPMIFAGAYYVHKVMVGGKDITFTEKLLLFTLFIPLFVTLPTQFALQNFDTSTCLATEGPIALYYTYIVESILLIAIVLNGIRSFRKEKISEKRGMITFLSVGILLFLLSFVSGNLIGSYSENWNLAQIGLFGAPIFVGFLSYLIVRFHAFNIKLFSGQLIVSFSTILIAALLLFRSTENVRSIIVVTLFLNILLGSILLRSMRREIEQKEKVERLAQDLQRANEGQTNLIHIINHQIKGYLAKARNIFAEFLPPNGMFKEDVKGRAQELSSQGFEILTEGVRFAQSVLNASSIEKGTIHYDMFSFDLKPIVLEVANTMQKIAEHKGLAWSITIAEGDYTMIGDAIQLREVFTNIFDNAIRYTKSGSITTTMVREKDAIVVKTVDTGVGIPLEDRNKLFTRGGRGKNSTRVNVDSTGYGLYFVKGVVEAHKGFVTLASDGEGKGTTCTIALPVKN